MPEGSVERPLNLWAVHGAVCAERSERTNCAI